MHESTLDGPPIDVPELFLDAPLLWAAPSKLSAERCAELCRRCDVLIEEQASPFAGRDRASFTDDKLSDELRSLVGMVIPHRLGDLEFLDFNPLFRFYRYGPGHSFPPHLDYWYMPDSREISLITLLCYLNEDFEGGETRFIDLPSKRPGQAPSNKVVSPSTGLVSFWQHQVLHEGMRVTRGFKRVLRTDLMFLSPGPIRRVAGINSAEYQLITSHL